MNHKETYQNNSKDEMLSSVSVYDLFQDRNFLIPIYQRNYAWGEAEIIQLIEDINGAIDLKKNNYFLGNLVLNKKNKQLDKEGFVNINEVIDGQQRLTTLYLLMNYLGLEIESNSLRFEARIISNQTLDWIAGEGVKGNEDHVFSDEIIRGYKIIENFFESNTIDKDKFKKKLCYVHLILVQVPEGIDLNHYFEIMNTRGEQLELHEIAKARIIDRLEASKDQYLAAYIWDACSNMDNYVQMNFEVNVRNKLFSKDWESLNENVLSFDDIKEFVTNDNKILKTRTLKDRLDDRSTLDIDNDAKNISNDEDQRFVSIISFSNFLLQANAVIKSEIKETSLDDKLLLKNLEWVWQEDEDEDKIEKRVKDFIFQLLKIRVIFDSYIIKREHVREYQDGGRWSLQKMKKYDKRQSYASYVATFEDNNNKTFRALQSALRITYTSPKTMHWIALVIKSIIKDEKQEEEIIINLENYCKQKIEDSNYQSKSGFGIERIVFTYLDYLLYRDGYTYDNKKIISPLSNWDFQFRQSIEHYFPQNPIGDDKWDDEDLNGFGNLALITISGNSFLSNHMPDAKAKVDTIVDQSLKLKVMAHITEESGWDKDASERHKREMYDIIEKGKSQ